MKPRQPSGVTLRDIAKSLGVSHVTVSRALRDSPRISASVRKQVQAQAVEMGYRPNPMATALGHLRFSVKSRSVTAELAWINCRPESENVRRFKEFDFYWKGASETAKWFGYHLEEFICNADFTLARLGKVLMARGVRGILLPPQSSLPSDWDAFPWEHFSVVRFGHSISRPRVHVVTSDQMSNSLLAFARVRARGYRRIGYASSWESSTHHKAGVLMEQSKLSHLERVPPFALPPNGSKQSIQKMFAHWLKKANPDAILTDIAAMREMLLEAGLKVPEDIGLAVFSVLDGNADAGIYQNPEEIGKAAAEMLISLINHNHTGVPRICRELLIEGDWVDGTTLPIRPT
jgi:LacI family transcriptional regulator